MPTTNQDKVLRRFKSQTYKQKTQQQFKLCNDRRKANDFGGSSEYILSKLEFCADTSFFITSNSIAHKISNAIKLIMSHYYGMSDSASCTYWMISAALAVIAIHLLKYLTVMRIKFIAMNSMWNDLEHSNIICAYLRVKDS